jgi:anaerobic selenocysteine-containing dehydrogenase
MPQIHVLMIDGVYESVEEFTLTAPAGSRDAVRAPTRGDVRMRNGKTRLTTPLVRDGGELRPASWDEALDRAAAGFARARATDTSTSFGVFSCSKASNEMNFLAAKFARQVMGTNNIDSCNRT